MRRIASVTSRRIILATAVSAIVMSGAAGAQEPGTATTTPVIVPTTMRIFTLMDFERFAPRNALDMLERVPGFAVRGGGQGRGLGQANTNVLVNGQRVSSKSQDIFDQLRRITVDNVEHIEIVDGATLELPGLSGQVANVITRNGGISGRYQYRTIHRPRYANPAWWGGELSVNGATTNTEWSAAYNHGSGRGGAGGPPGFITDANGNITEYRDIHIKFIGEFPRLSGSFKWNGPNDMIANLNAQYSRRYQDFSNDEQRMPVDGVDNFRDFDYWGRGYGYEVGGDFEFNLGPGKLKLIGLNRLDDDDSRNDSALVFADASPTTGNRFASQSRNAERIGRSEYRWDMLGGNWEVDAEAAYNKYEQASQFYTIEDTGGFTAVELPNSAGEVTEDRYEVIVTHGRTLAEGLTLQLSVGGERSTLAQSGQSGLTRTFWRPKGSMSLAWTPLDGLDVSLNVARKVGQLSFGQFLADVDLALGNANSGNEELKPTLTWETNLQVKQNFGDWGSTTVQLYNTQYDDYIDIIPLSGGGESQGNIASAKLLGAGWNSTINLDPMGWEGVRIDMNLKAERSYIEDPLTGQERPFSNHYDRNHDISLRHDIPGTDWAWGISAQYNHVQPSYRIAQVSVNFEGPTYKVFFIEHKDFFGLTANLQVFNFDDKGNEIFRRTVYEGPRTEGNVLFNENRKLLLAEIFRFQVTGNF